MKAGARLKPWARVGPGRTGAARARVGLRRGLLTPMERGDPRLGRAAQLMAHRRVTSPLPRPDRGSCIFVRQESGAMDVAF